MGTTIMTRDKLNLTEINRFLKGKTPEAIVQWALDFAKKPLVTTNFRPYEAVILHAVSTQKPDVTVVWCDTGYNTSATYRHAVRTIERLKLQVDLFVPQQTVAYRDVVMGIPEIEDRKSVV